MNDLQLMKLDSTDISRWDIPELKRELQVYLADYEGLVYTDETIKDAKRDRTELNKAKKIVDDARKAFRARCLEPYDSVEPQIRELTELIEKRRQEVDEIVKDYEERQRQKKEEEVRAYYQRKAVILGDLAEELYPKIFDKKWVNASTARGDYEQAVLIAVNKAHSDIETIKAMSSPFEDLLLRTYTETLSIDQAREKNAELVKATEQMELSVRKDTVQDIAADGKDQKLTESLNVSAPASDGVILKIHASESQINQILDFMKAIGADYELL